VSLLPSLLGSFPKTSVSFQTWNLKKEIVVYKFTMQLFCLNLQNPGSVPSATSRLSPLPHEPYDRGVTTDIPLDSSKVDWMWKCRNIKTICLNAVIASRFNYILNFRISKQRRRNFKLERLNWKKGNRWLLHYLIIFRTQNTYLWVSNLGVIQGGCKFLVCKVKF
jgi:hypothetical protein